MRGLVTSLLHQQGPRHRARPGHRAIHCQRSRRKNHARKGAGAQHNVYHRVAREPRQTVGGGSCGGGETVKASLLIVDDEANTLATLSRAFRLAGHEATVCDNAVKAVELAKSDHFDMIFSDVVMPGRDGLSLLEDLRAQGVTTPVVMMSGQAHIAMAVRATKLRAFDFLEKTIFPDKTLLK